LRKIPVVTVPQVSQDIGSALKSRREAKGHSLDAVSQHTRIPKRFLDALEKNQLDEFPALVYLRGFLKNYCEYLELDFEAIWALVQPPAAPEAKDAAQAAPVEPKEHPPAGRDNSPAGALLFAAALALGTFLFLRKSGPEKAESSPEVPAALAPLDNQAQRALTLTFRQEAWVSLKADGALLFEGRAPQGARQEWKAKKSFSLRTPQPQNLDMTLDAASYRLSSPQAGGEYKIE
jgi:cytoskeletal protein RodZ